MDWVSNGPIVNGFREQIERIGAVENPFNPFPESVDSACHESDPASFKRYIGLANPQSEIRNFIVRQRWPE